MVKESKLYDILGVPTDVDTNRMKKAYFRLAQEFNPNVPENKEKFQQINNAYEILKDEEKRKLYDQYGLEGMKQAEQMGGGMGGMGSVFDAFFGGGGRQRQQGPKQAQAVGKEVAITLEQIYNGGEMKISLERQGKCKVCDGVGGTEANVVGKCSKCQGRGVVIITSQRGNMITQQQSYCPQCKGTGEFCSDPSKICKACKGQRAVQEEYMATIRIDPGTADKDQQTLFGEGNWEPGINQGDYVVIFREQKHQLFRREEADLFMDKVITLDEAICGTSFTIKELNGETSTIFRKPGECINHGQVLCVKGHGMPIKGRVYEHGNLFIKFEVKFPKQISPEIRDLLLKVIGTEESKKRIMAASQLKHDGVKTCELIYVDPKFRTKNENTTKGQKEYGDQGDEDVRGAGGAQQVQCGAM